MVNDFLDDQIKRSIPNMETDGLPISLIAYSQSPFMPLQKVVSWHVNGITSKCYNVSVMN